MAAKDKTAPETIRVRLGNGHTTSAGAGTPGDVVELPPTRPWRSSGTATRAGALMALSRFVLITNVTLTPDAVAAVVAGEPGTGGPAGFGNSATIIPSALSEGKYGLPGMPLTLLAGTVVYADSTAGFATGAAAAVPGDRGGATCARTSRARMTLDMQLLASIHRVNRAVFGCVDAKGAL